MPDPGRPDSDVRASEPAPRAAPALPPSRVGTWEWNIATGEIRWDPVLEAIYGLDPGTFGGTFNDFAARIHPDDAPFVLKKVQEAMDAGSGHYFEHRIVLPGGGVRWLAGWGVVVRDGEGRIAGMAGGAADIDARTRAAESLAREKAQSAVLQSLACGLASAATPTEVAGALLEHAVKALGAAAGAVSAPDPTGTALEVIAIAGNPRSSQAARWIPLERAGAAAAVMTHGRAEWDAEGTVATGARAGDLASIIPLPGSGRPIGVLEVVQAADRPVRFDERGFLLSLAGVGAQALTRAGAFQREQSTRKQFENANRRLLAIQAVTDSALSHLALDELLPVVLERLRQVLEVDSGAILLLAPDQGRLVVRAAAGLQLHDEAHEDVPYGAGFAGRVASSRRPLIVDDLTDFPIVSRFVRENLTSLMGAPLIADGRVLGVVHVGTREPRTFTTDDLALLQRVADRATMAIRNSQLFEEKAKIAETLQRSLLPPALPEIPGVELAACYRSAGDVAVGGDFYDMFPARGRDWAVVMGDVAGKGASAAAVTALARYVLRTAVIQEPRPSRALALLNRMMLREHEGERFCTVALGRLRPEGDGVRLTVACAGHPPPLLLSDGATVREVAQPGQLLGAFPDARVSDVVTRLDPGDAVLFFTDGVYESRQRAGRTIDDEMRAELAACAGLDAPGILARMEAWSLHPEAGPPRDDIALVALRVAP